MSEVSPGADVQGVGQHVCRLSGLKVLGATVPLFMPLMPIIFRYSRVIWAHLDWTIDPGA